MKNRHHDAFGYPARTRQSLLVEPDHPARPFGARRDARATLSGRHFADCGIAAAGPANVAALETLVQVGDDMGTAGPFTPRLPGNWETLDETRVVQMIRVDRSPLPEGDLDTSILGNGDVSEMLALVELTKPGPFRSRTIELGAYLGVREGRRLVAMAGERMWVGDFREVSAVCTHPDARGRGYASALMARVINRMLRAGQTPFNAGAAMRSDQRLSRSWLHPPYRISAAARETDQ